MSRGFKVSGPNVTVNLGDPTPVINKLAGLADNLQKNAGRAAAKKGMAIVRDAAIANAKRLDDPKTPEAVWKNIVVNNSARRGKRIGGIVMRVGVRGGARKEGNKKDVAPHKPNLYVDNEENRALNRVGLEYRQAKGKIARDNPGGDTWYWRFLEFGTEKTRARPFIQSTLAENVQAVTDAVATELNKGIDKAISKQSNGSSS